LYETGSAAGHGSPLDVNTHVARFPVDGGVLKTGSNRTYTIPGRSIVVGPNRLTDWTIAHEFGYILGFTARYIRSARDLGRAGYGSLEIMPDALDLMAGPRSAFVRPSHFQSLIDAWTQHAR